MHDGVIPRRHLAFDYGFPTLMDVLGLIFGIVPLPGRKIEFLSPCGHMLCEYLRDRGNATVPGIHRLIGVALVTRPSQDGFHGWRRRNVCGDGRVRSTHRDDLDHHQENNEYEHTPAKKPLLVPAFLLSACTHPTCDPSRRSSKSGAIRRRTAGMRRVLPSE